MNLPLSTLLLFVASTAVAADLPPIPEHDIAVKRELLFSDDFESENIARVWHRVVPQFTFEHADSRVRRSATKPFPPPTASRPSPRTPAVHGLEIPTTNSVVEARIRFQGASMINVEFDDRKYTAHITATSAAPRCASTA